MFFRIAFGQKKKSKGAIDLYKVYFYLLTTIFVSTGYEVNFCRRPCLKFSLKNRTGQIGLEIYCFNLIQSKLKVENVSIVFKLIFFIDLVLFCSWVKLEGSDVHIVLTVNCCVLLWKNKNKISFLTNCTLLLTRIIRSYWSK